MSESKKKAIRTEGLSSPDERNTKKKGGGGGGGASVRVKPKRRGEYQEHHKGNPREGKREEKTPYRLC